MVINFVETNILGIETHLYVDQKNLDDVFGYQEEFGGGDTHSLLA